MVFHCGNMPEDTNKPVNPVQNVPKTGDETNAAFYIAMMFVMGAVILGYVRKRRVF